MFRRVFATIAAFGVVVGGLTLSAAPVQALPPETITSNYDVWAADQTGTVALDITINGFPNMTTAVRGYPYKLVFYGMTPDARNTGTGCGGTWGTQTGVTFSAAAPGVGAGSTGNVDPLGFVDGSTTYAGCRWASTSDFRFAYNSAQLFSSTTLQTLSFPNASFEIPTSGEYGVQLRGGGSWTGLVSAICFGNCPASGGSTFAPPPIRLDFDGNGGTCSPGFVEGDEGTWGTALTAENCTNGARKLEGFSTSPTLAIGSVFVRPGGPIYFLEANRLYAIWAVATPSAPQDVVATPGRNSMTVTWKPPASDGGDPILGYQVRGLAGNGTSSQSACLVGSAVFTCKFSVPATNVTYTYTVLAYNRAGNGQPSNPSAAVSPYDFGTISASRPNILLGLGGSRVEASGAALGLSGKAVNAQYKVGNAKDWTTQANAATVNSQGKFSWSRKFAAGVNKQNVTVRFTYGGDAVSDTLVLSRGGQSGSLTAPRNIKVENVVNRVIVTWDPPKFDGGEKITGYTMCANGAGSLCRNVPADGRGVFQNLATGREYTITVAAKTATRTGPEATAKQKVSPVEASTRITRRLGQEIRVQVEATGFKAGAKFRLESAVAVPGEPASAWRWEELRSFTGSGKVNREYAVELGSLYDGETIAVRLVTSNGTVYSRLSRP